ncbi:hypothetical protein [Nostoc sp.]|uniref:hypothetical protein n=1 Tax=Nostoc sp. TaxID=1180 RepID=UPI002FF91011
MWELPTKKPESAGALREEGSPDETSFTALNERITGDWGLGTSIFTQHSARAKRSATANSTFQSGGSRQELRLLTKPRGFQASPLAGD